MFLSLYESTLMTLVIVQESLKNINCRLGLSKGFWGCNPPKRINNIRSHHKMSYSIKSCHIFILSLIYFVVKDVSSISMATKFYLLSIYYLFLPKTYIFYS